MPRWKHWYAIHEITRARLCFRTQDSLVQQIEVAKELSEKSDAVINAKDRQIELERAGGQILRQQINILQQEIGDLRHEVSRQKLLTIAVSIASVIAIIIML